MVKEILTYPQPLSANYSTDVRKFNEELFSLIDDLKDTIEANNLEGLAAFQIGSMYNVIVIKKEDCEYLELINPRLFNMQNRVKKPERTAYFPGMVAEIERFEKVSIAYQDRNGNDKFMTVEGDLARLIQRKVDYMYGSTFVNKMTKEEKKEFESRLSSGIEVASAAACPTTFVRDKFIKVANYIKAFMLLLLVSSFFISDESSAKLWDYQLYLSFAVVAFNGMYFAYGLYEGQKYKQCTSCQIGNFIGTVAISFTKLTILMLLSYYFM